MSPFYTKTSAAKPDFKVVLIRHAAAAHFTHFRAQIRLTKTIVKSNFRGVLAEKEGLKASIKRRRNS